jgi:hypothetical protein
VQVVQTCPFFTIPAVLFSTEDLLDRCRHRLRKPPQIRDVIALRLWWSGPKQVPRRESKSYQYWNTVLN